MKAGTVKRLRMELSEFLDEFTRPMGRSDRRGWAIARSASRCNTPTDRMCSASMPLCISRNAGPKTVRDAGRREFPTMSVIARDRIGGKREPLIGFWRRDTARQSRPDGDTAFRADDSCRRF